MTKEEDELLLKARSGRAAMMSQQINPEKGVSSSADSDEPPDPFAPKDTPDALAQDLQPPQAEPVMVGFEVGLMPRIEGMQGMVAIKATAGENSILGGLTVDQARAMAANLAQVCDSINTTQATIFVVTEKLSWTIPNQALSFRYVTETRSWGHAWNVPHKVVPKGNGKSELKRGTALILPPGTKN